MALVVMECDEHEQTVNTGMAVFYDRPQPSSTRETLRRERLSLWALAKDYGKTDIVFSGPLLKDVSINNHQATLTFDHIGSGLENAEEESAPTILKFPGADGEYFHADAKIVGDSVVLHPL